MMDMLRNGLANNSGKRTVYARDWLRQIKDGVTQVFPDGGDSWLLTHDKGHVSDDVDCKPRLQSVSDTELISSVQHCYRRFATVGEMNQHIRLDHKQTVEADSTLKFPCRVKKCYRKHKTLGWLEWHYRECHPDFVDHGATPECQASRSSSRHQFVQGDCSTDFPGTSLGSGVRLRTHCNSKIKTDKRSQTNKNGGKSTLYP